VGDDPERVAENARRFAEGHGLSLGQLASVNQVHGDRLLEVIRLESGETWSPPLGDADGLYTRTPGAALCIGTADCVPVLLCAPDVGAVAAVHAGWRGTKRRIVARAVESLGETYGADPRGVFAVVGPSIRVCCYDVDTNLAASFRAEFGATVLVSAPADCPRLDLAEANRLTLRAAGVPEEKIDVLPFCTSCLAERFFSHRRDRGVTGRHLSYVMCEQSRPGLP
jgi:YfiH family protein